MSTRQQRGARYVVGVNLRDGLGGTFVASTVESVGRARPMALHFRLLGDLQRVIDLASEVSHGALTFAMAEKKLYRPEIAVLR